MEHVAVDCTFNVDGTVQVRRIEINGRWRTVEQGRQWVDGNGRCVLLMMPADSPGGAVQMLVLRPATLRWELHPRRSGQTLV